MATKYYVEQLFYNDGWENVWKDEDGNPQTFDTYMEARAELEQFIMETHKDYDKGNLETPYYADEFRIVETTSKVVWQGDYE